MLAEPALILCFACSGPMPFMIEVAAVLAGAVEDWEDFSIILTLLFVNASIG